MLADTTEHPIGLEISHAKGAFLFDTEGNKYLDFIAGVSVNNLGHAIPEIEQAVLKQMQLHTHVMVYGEYVQNSVMEFSKTLTSLLPNCLNTVYPLNSGTEAIEAALKIAKRYTGNAHIVSLTGAYHGNTHGSMSVSHNEVKKSPYRPLVPGVEFIEWNSTAALSSIDQQTACVILETVQGDAGVRIPSKDYLQALRRRCTSTNTLLILDEIQCGFGRTGTFSAFEQFDIVPDILCLGKALGGGLPIGALVGDKNIMSVIQRNPALGHITTFGGNPVVCAAANAALLKYKDLEANLMVQEKSHLFESLLQQHKEIVAIRRLGMMIGIDLKSAEKTAYVINRCREKGLLLFWFLSVPTSFRISPPLTISMEEIKKGCEVLLTVLDEL